MNLNPQITWAVQLGNQRVLRFAIVGGSGTVFNNALLYLCVSRAHFAVPVAGLLSTATTSLTNFSLNDRFTFAAPTRGWAKRALRFNIIAVAGLAISVATLSLLTEMGVPYLLANIAGIGLAFSWNYLGSARFAFGEQVRG